jgi:hypothetical protein
VHVGRKAATILAPSTPRPFDARLRLVMAPFPVMASVRAVTPAEKERTHKSGYQINEEAKVHMLARFT